MKTLAIVAILVSVLAACSGKEDESTGVIPQAQLDALEKAKGVEATLEQQEQNTRRKIDEAQ